MKKKLIIYQTFVRIFGNRNLTRKEFGTIAENGAGKMNDFTSETLKQIRDFGANCIWFTGILRHATTTDYFRFGIPSQNPRVVKGRAGSPYAIVDYYDIDPDLAVDVSKRMQEFEALVKRTHEKGMMVAIDFVPNHVARQYKSIAKPDGVSDLGENDDCGKHFSAENNFYYCPGCALDLSDVPVEEYARNSEPYEEFPARCTGNDRFDAHPGANDWFETVKLNYGVDYCDAGGRSNHFSPTPDTWRKMTDILLFWAQKGVDVFRCDMAEMVPTEFWQYAKQKVKQQFPEIIFVGEVYNPAQYRDYIAAGFDYLYDKVGMYDTLRDVICNHRPATDITFAWQQTDDIRSNMLYFLENHDEQRIASTFFANDPTKAIPAMLVAALLGSNPLMIYAGQEYGELGMDKEGFSGCDGRSTIFDYWALESIYRGYINRQHLVKTARNLGVIYKNILRIANRNIISEGLMYDLMYANPQSTHFDSRHLFTFMRRRDNETLLVVANFSDQIQEADIIIPAHAFDFLALPESDVTATDLLTSRKQTLRLRRDKSVSLTVHPHDGCVMKF